MSIGFILILDGFTLCTCESKKNLYKLEKKTFRLSIFVCCYSFVLLCKFFLNSFWKNWNSKETWPRNLRAAKFSTGLSAKKLWVGLAISYLMSAVSCLFWLTTKIGIRFWRCNGGMNLNNETVQLDFGLKLCKKISITVKQWFIPKKNKQQFEALWQNSLRRTVRTAKSLSRNVFTTKCSHGELYSWRSVLTAKFPHGEMFLRRSVLTGNVLTRSVPRQKLLQRNVRPGWTS